jgi:exonuclease III
LTFLIYNILDGGQGRQDALREIILSQNADVVLLQEVESGWDLPQDWFLHSGYQYFLADSNSKRKIALLTKLRIIKTESFHPRRLRHTCLRAELEYAPGKTFTVYGLHLCAPAYTLPLEIYRLLELRAILKYARQTAADKFLVAGDFNAIAPGDKTNFKNLPFSLRLSVFLHGGYVARQVIGYLRLRGFTDAFRALHPKADGYTLPANQPNSRLDYFLLNAGLVPTLRACDVVTQPALVQQASDHLPVRMELDFNALSSYGGNL